MRKVTITCEWRTSHVIEVPDDFMPENLAELPVYARDQISSNNAKLTDWYGGI